MRHYREKHEPGLDCLYPGCDYEWSHSRRSEYRKHLTKKHGLVDDKIDEILAMAPRRCHRGGRVIESDQMVPLLAAGKDANHASLTVIPSVANNPRLWPAAPEITITSHEDSSGIEHLAATHAPSMLISKEDSALLGEYYKTHGRFRFVQAFLCATYMIDSALRFPSVHPGGSTTADLPPNPGMLHIPAFPSPVGGYHTSPVSGKPFSPPSIERLPRRH